MFSIKDVILVHQLWLWYKMQLCLNWRMPFDDTLFCDKRASAAFDTSAGIVIMFDIQ